MAGVNANVIGQQTTDFTGPALAGAGKFRVFTTCSYTAMIEGFEVDIDMACSPREVSDLLLPIVQRDECPVEGPPQLQVYLAGGLPFSNGKLGDFYGNETFKDAHRVLYVVVTRRIPETLLTSECPELCNAASEDKKLLLSPVVPSSEAGLSNVACFLGYLNHDGLKGDAFVKVLAQFTGFTPLIFGLYRMIEKISVLGRHVVAVTAALYGFYQSQLIASTCPPVKVFEYVLQCSSFVLHGFQQSELDSMQLPVTKAGIDYTRVGDPLVEYCSRTNQGKTVLLWMTDIHPDRSFPRKKQERPKDPLAIENAFNLLGSFRPVAPLTTRSMSSAGIVQVKDRKTILYLSASQGKGAGASNMIDVIDPSTGFIDSRDVEELAKAVGNVDHGGATQLIDPEKVMQVIQVCFDESGSMAGTLSGYRCDTRRGDIPRVTIATQYLTTFANRTYAYRVPCIQGLISFNDQIRVRSPLSALVPDFEDGIKKVVPSSTTHLWDALMKAAQDLTAAALDPKTKKKKYPNAALRVLVISDGEDVESTVTAPEACQALFQAGVVCDAVIISSEDACKTLCAICHITGGLAFRPNSIEEGLALFDQEAFLMCNQRKRPPRYRGRIDEPTLRDLTGRAAFDTRAENAVLSTATSRLPLATPRYIIFQNQTTEIPDPRRRRILRELHAAAAVQDPTAKATDEDSGVQTDLYDPDLRIYPFRGHLDQWRVIIKGTDGTPYANKWWYMYVTFPDSYPISPPVFQFVSVPFHMNVSQEGRVCLNLIEKGYMASAPVVELIQNIKQLFLMPDLDTPIQLAKLDLWKSNRAEYERLARKSADDFGKNTADEWLHGLAIEQDVPDTFSVVVKDHVPPYLRSQMSGKAIPRERQVRASSGAIYDREELRQLVTSSRNPVCVITGKPLTETEEDFL
jgi:ubiquitin-conjugating enzyme E2 D/E